MQRDVEWYKNLINQVKCRKKDNDNDRGRLLCQGLLRDEFSKDDLAAHNLTGVSRGDNNKFVHIPKLDERVLNSIFMQAKIQFSGFEDSHLQLACETVKALNRICKVARKELSLAATARNRSNAGLPFRPT